MTYPKSIEKPEYAVGDEVYALTHQGEPLWNEGHYLKYSVVNFYWYDKGVATPYFVYEISRHKDKGCVHRHLRGDQLKTREQLVAYKLRK